MRNIPAVIEKEFIHIRRDKRTLLLIVLMPLVQLIIYGYGVNLDVKHLAAIIYDEDKTPMSRRLVEAFEQSAYFDKKESVESFIGLRKAIDRGEAKVGIHIPVDFTKDLLSGHQSQLQFLIDGTDSNPANIALNTSQAVVTAFIKKEGLMDAELIPIDFRPRMWYNPDLKSSFFLIPGLVGFLLQLLIPMVTAAAIVREKERGNLEQLLVTPIKRHELIIGKLIPYIILGLGLASMILFFAQILFHVPIRGNAVLLFVLTFLFLTVCLGFGLFASTVAQNQHQAAQFIMFLAGPSILLSGFIFPRENMPWLIYHLGFFIPLTYFLKIIRGIMLKGLGLIDLWVPVAVLLSMAAAGITLSILKFHKRLT